MPRRSTRKRTATVAYGTFVSEGDASDGSEPSPKRPRKKADADRGDGGEDGAQKRGGRGKDRKPRRRKVDVTKIAAEAPLLESADEASTATIAALRSALQAAGNAEYAATITQYMRNKFPHFGIKVPQRVEIVRTVLATLNYGNDIDTIHAVVRAMWEEEERDFQHSGIQLLRTYESVWAESTLDLCRELVTTKPWWDTVDPLAKDVAGRLVAIFPHLVTVMDEWVADTEAPFWLRRAGLLHQLGYKTNTDEARLWAHCEALMGEEEWFMRKAIGWALRQYSHTNPAPVRAFLDAHADSLSKLSFKEASKYC